MGTFAGKGMIALILILFVAGSTLVILSVDMEGFKKAVTIIIGVLFMYVPLSYKLSSIGKERFIFHWVIAVSAWFAILYAIF